MNDNAIGLVFCSPKTAKQFVTKEPEMAESLVVTTVLSDDECILVEKDEFIEWLKGKEKE